MVLNSRVTIIAACLFLVVSFTHAEIIYVNSSGTGDVATIQAAISEASEGDEVVLAPGLYQGEGNRDVSIDIDWEFTMRSEDNDPESCVIDCEGNESSPHRGLVFQEYDGDGVTIRGIKIINAFLPVDSPNSSGGAVKLGSGTHPTFDNCIFENNSADSGAVVGYGYLVYPNQRPAFIDCVFRANRAKYGGAVYLYGGTFTNCVFDNNGPPTGTSYSGSAAWLGGNNNYFTDCLFYNNYGGNLIFAVSDRVELLRCGFYNNNNSSIVIDFSHAVIEDCVFYQNQGGPVISVSGIYDDVIIQGCTIANNQGNSIMMQVTQSENTIINRCIIAFNDGARAMGTNLGALIQVSCCNFYGNEMGDWVWELEDYLGIDGNIHSDPLFCDAELFDFRLEDDSPCAPDNNDCGLMCPASIRIPLSDN